MSGEREAGHHHSHAHAWTGLVSGWTGWRHDPVRIAIVATLGVLALATLIGAIVVWPDGSAAVTSDATAQEIGLAPEQLTATAVSVTDQACSFDDAQRCRSFEFALNDGPDAGTIVTVPELSLEFAQNVPPVSVGDDVVLNYEPTTDTYSYADRDRRLPLVALAVLFGVVVIALARFRGVLALASMAFTVVVLVGFIAPAVLDGQNPIAVAVVGAAAIAFVGLFLTHGVNPPTAVALLATLLALALTLALSALFFAVADFTGLASEEATILPLLSSEIDLAGLLLGGAILGALGALDDVTVTQVATVMELRAQRPDLPRRQMIAAGIRIGRSHIASTVNTLLLAYAGASIPLLLLFSASSQSLDQVANSEVVAVEIARTMCGSIGLVAAVPLATALAALVATAPMNAPAETAPPDWDDFAPRNDFWGDD